MYGLTPEQQVRAWKRVSKEYDEPTAADVETVVAEVLETKKARPEASSSPAMTGTIVCADCIKGLGTLDDASIDLCLFSPPYCQQRQDHYPGVEEKDYPDWMASVMAAIQPKLAKTGNVLIVAREHLRNGQISDVWLKTRLAIRAADWIECETMIWHSPDKPPLGRPDRPRRTWEYIFWFSQIASPFVDLRACGTEMTEDRTRMLRPRRRKSHLGGNVHRPFERFRTYGVARATDLIHAPVGGVSPGIDHVAMFPPQLADHLVRTFSPEGGLVADPMAGSGTSLLAARDAGRRWWGCDIVPEYVALARRRLKANPAG